MFERRGAAIPAGIWTGFLALLVFLPSANFALFAGIPLTSAPSLLGALVVVVLVLSKEARERYGTLLGSGPGLRTAAVLALVVVAVAAKGVLLVSGEHSGFGACYRTPSSLYPAAARSPALDHPLTRCERSYANPIGRFGGLTRLDPEIDFNESNWNLDFFNSVRFDFLPGRPGLPSRSALPFLGTWQGTVNISGDQPVLVRYVGQGRIVIGDRSSNLPPSYSSPRTVTLRAPRGRRALRVDFVFDPPSLQPGLQAAISVTRANGGPLRPSAPRTWLVSLTTDVPIAVLALIGVAAVLLTIRRWILVALLAGLAGAAVVHVIPGRPFVHDAATAMVECLLVLSLGWLVKRRRLSTAAAMSVLLVGVVVVQAARLHVDFPPLGHVGLKSAGDDWLTYDSQAHNVLSGSLRGGEAVFVYSPVFRYLLALGHIFLGAGDTRLALVVLSAIIFTVAAFGLFAILRIERGLTEVQWHGRRWPSASPGYLAAALALLVTLLLSSSNEFAGQVNAPLSESATWLFVPAALTLLLLPVAAGCWVPFAVAALCGFAVITRFDQGIGVFALMCLAAATWWARGAAARRQRLRALAGPLALFVLIVMLPALHNLVYGHRLVITPGIPVDFPLPLSKFPSICCDAGVRRIFVSQLKGVTAFGSGLGVTRSLFWLLGSVWLGTVVVVLVAWRRTSWTTRAVAALPLAFLLPYLSVQVYTYYPRHIVLGYMVMGLSATYVAVSIPAGRAPRSAQNGGPTPSSA